MAGARIWVVNKVDFSDNRNLIVAAVTLVLFGLLSPLEHRPLRWWDAPVGATGARAGAQAMHVDQDVDFVGRDQPRHDGGNIATGFWNIGNAAGLHDALGAGIVGGKCLFEIAAKGVQLLAQVAGAALKIGDGIVWVDT